MKPTPNETMRLSSSKWNEATQKLEKLYSVEMPIMYDHVDESVIHDWTEYKSFLVQKWYEDHFTGFSTELELKSFPHFAVVISQGGKKPLKFHLNYWQVLL